jgi:formate dehydrogenase maturation protein FdhE
MGVRYVICPKVALTDLFMIVRPNENVHFFNKIFRKHVDFLLCDPKTFAPSFGVEIVKPIAKEGMREADKFLAELFTDAGVPLVHIPSSETYDAADLIALFQLAVVKVGKNPSADTVIDSVPSCPVCGKMMVLRMHRNGSEVGKKYYGCIDSPTCKGMVTIG